MSNYYDTKSDRELEDVRWYDRNSNSFIQAVTERTSLSLEQKVRLITGGNVSEDFRGNLRKSTWDLIGMIAQGKEVEMTSNLEPAYRPLIEDKLVYLDRKVVTATVQDDELGEIKIDRVIKVIRMSALAIYRSKSILEKGKTHAQKELARYSKLGLL